MGQGLDGDKTPRGGRPGIIRRSLQWRIMLLVTIGIVAILVAFSIISMLAVSESIDRSVDERRALAEATGGHVDYVVRQSLEALDEIPFGDGFDLEDADPEPERRALRRAFFGTIFSRGVYLTDASGRLLWIEPETPSVLGKDISTSPHVADALESGASAVSGLTAAVADGGPAVSMVVPVRNLSGKLVGLVGGDIGLSGSNLQEVIYFASLSETGYAQIVDAEGAILASTRADQTLETTDHRHQVAALIEENRTSSGTCHDCHESENGEERQTEVMAFAPLQSAPWGVLIRESEDEALAPARRLKERALWLGVGAFSFALLFGWATVRSITRPVATLTDAAQRIASGDLSRRVPILGRDEIGHLAMVFEVMRIKLSESLETIQAQSRELELRVRERTRELEESRDSLRAVAEENAALYEELKRKEAARGRLLKKVIGAQEEERRRIARELHDETSQSLTALAVGLETASLTSESGAAGLQRRLASLKELAVETLERVHGLIYDLRPSVLDDLGLVAGLRWYAESRLQPADVRVRLQVKGKERRLPAEAETALFRIGQEAVNNAARHARASAVALTLTFDESRVALEVEDDGEGFDVAATGEASGKHSGWGLMGMEERATLLGGSIEIVSRPGRGTRVRAVVPVEKESDDDAQDPGPDSG